VLDYFVPTVLFVLGACVGSFLNVVVLRFNSERSSLWERSQCRQCHKTLRWWELVPIISYLGLRGRCARCGARLLVQYPLVELCLGIVFVWVLYPLPLTVADLLQQLLLIAAIAGLLTIGLIDFYTFLLPDTHILFLTGVAVLLQLLHGNVVTLGTLLAVIGGAGFLLMLWLITRGQGIGLGDVKLMVPLGLLLGGMGTVVLLFGAFCLGGMIGALLLLRGSAVLKTPIPFGPFLAGMAIVLLLLPGLPEHFFSLLFW
jgi:prepilin signal peptidase PulO-like enzyme (type II secretory pathway)